MTLGNEADVGPVKQVYRDETIRTQNCNMQCTTLAGKMIPWRQVQNAVKNKTNIKYGKIKMCTYRCFNFLLQ